MKRCYYIANNYDGAYFVITDDLNEYRQRMSAYLMNLQASGKCNHYSFGSVELTEKDYIETRNKAMGLERDRVQTKIEKEEPILTPPPPKKNDGDRPHLRLV